MLACGQTGHIQRDCRLSTVRPEAKKQQGGPNVHARGATDLTGACVYIQLRLEGRNIMCLLDTGCDTNLFPYSLLKRIKGISVTESNKHVLAANDTEVTIIGEAAIPLTLENRSLKTFALLSPDVEEVMLGIDWLRKNKCIWDFCNQRLYVDGLQVPLLNQEGHTRCRRVLIQEDTTIPPRGELDIPARSTLLSIRNVGSEGMVESRRLRSGVYVGRTLLPPSHKGLQVRMANTTNKPQLVKRGTCLGELDTVEVLDDKPRIEEDDKLIEPQDDVREILMDKLPEDMTMQRRWKTECVQHTPLYTTESAASC